MNGSRWPMVGARLFLMLMTCIAPLQAQQRPPEGPPPRRMLLEGEVRRSFARLVREGAGLSDEQMTRLAPITRKHEQQRRALQQEERGTRMSLQTELRREVPDTGAVSRLLDRLLDVQRRRFQLVEAEHRDLATVMTPVQRARYLALQEQVRRRMEQMRQGRPR